ncbi:thiol-disulfide isomerase/thioredoxin/streptogramin lyase [Streptomyces canus]|uniref:NHL domain-containing thioredoxin family protein n=1 Tax=Streptomyces canus TaxID=58343 RepID=UPI0027861948|nr:NHL domain-containing thioredoxin family protein [Streptomyces canus]MDQ0600364.1 thiol-disulfide isomerase/thioredoxin/streptogramin lyase [Streptomyces canus]
MSDSAPRRVRVRAPELVGKGGWLNTGGKQYTLADLRGRIVVLDFWTFCCVNCLHVIDELRELEHQHPDTVVVIGVHSPKFVHEAEHAAVVDAVERYGVEHPVLDDPELATWQQYAVRAWPTLVVVDPEGYVVAQHAGEGHVHAIERLVRELETEHEAKGTLRRGDGPYAAPEPEATVLRFPGKAVLLPSGNLLVSDTTRHQLVELAPDAETVVRRIGQGDHRGMTDSTSVRSRFNEPQGLALLPDGSVVVADTVNHTLRRYDPESGRTTTLAGTGHPWMRGDDTSGPAREVNLSSPWDVAWWHGKVWIAMAGIHQLWTYDPADKTVAVAAGTTNEGLVDGPAAEAWFAQPSGLGATPERLWVADSETSALRWVDTDGTVHTAVGTGLFDFGHRDGATGQALLQHPLGVTALPDGSVAVSDTYNHALRRYDPATGEVTTLATDLREPSGAVLVGDDLVVVESARHRLTRLRLPEEAVRMESVAHRTPRAATEVAPGRLRLDVVFQAPAGQKLDTRYGPSTRLLISATPPGLLVEGDGAGTELSRTLHLDPAVAEGVLHVSAMAASCDDDPRNAYPACHVHQQDWGVPVRLAEGGTDRLPLVLAGMDDQAL